MQTFEERLQRLEDISSQIRSGSVNLEETAQLFEEGITLSKKLEKELSKVERRIEVLISGKGGDEEEPSFELFPELKDE